MKETRLLIQLYFFKFLFYFNFFACHIDLLTIEQYPFNCMYFQNDNFKAVFYQNFLRENTGWKLKSSFDMLFKTEEIE